nr:hypothetical protein BaRGS_016032 [Batillaria attramentaria]
MSSPVARKNRITYRKLDLGSNPRFIAMASLLRFHADFREFHFTRYQKCTSKIRSLRDEVRTGEQVHI